jgi:hypothetical protein
MSTISAPITTSFANVKTMTKSERDVFFYSVLTEAKDVGYDAGDNMTPHGMTVVDARQSHFIADGVCGFAGIVIHPANSPFANWLKKNQFASSNYGGGVYIRIGAHNQSLQRKEANARAMVTVFKKWGLENVYSTSRMD